jgi:hypothetical protein
MPVIEPLSPKIIFCCARAQISRWIDRVHGVCVELPMPN